MAKGERLRRLRIDRVLGAIATAVVAAACSAGPEDVASLTPSVSSIVSSRQVESAKAIVKCLQSKGVPARLNIWDDGQAELGFDSDPPWILCQEQDGMCHMGGGENDSPAEAEAKQRRMGDLEAKYQAELASSPADAVGWSYLISDTGDFTEPYRQCAETIDYVPPIWGFDPAQELAFKQAVAEVTNEWIACARDNGHPGIADVEALSADGFQTEPMAVLPLSITPTELGLLFEACPISRFVAGDIEPRLGYDAPGWDGREPRRDAATPDQITQQKIDALVEVWSP
ncbi:MAG: hypothetical protein FWD29_04160 [Micrococcales bacterium]|nr:hypothetical protein [Micrococcales bacterium]